VCGSQHYPSFLVVIASACFAKEGLAFYRWFGADFMTTDKFKFNLRRTNVKLKLRFICLVLIAGAVSYASTYRPLVLHTASAQSPENETQVDKTLSPYFLVKGDPSVDHLPLKDTRVDIAVSGVIADVKVVQTYRNEGSRPINASYVFPASTRAAVYAMRMRIGDRVVVAKIKEKVA
jgi:hypothetical protein